MTAPKVEVVFLKQGEFVQQAEAWLCGIRTVLLKFTQRRRRLPSFNFLARAIE